MILCQALAILSAKNRHLVCADISQNLGRMPTMTSCNQPFPVITPIAQLLSLSSTPRHAASLQLKAKRLLLATSCQTPVDRQCFFLPPPSYVRDCETGLLARRCGKNAAARISATSSSARNTQRTGLDTPTHFTTEQLKHAGNW